MFRPQRNLYTGGSIFSYWSYKLILKSTVATWVTCERILKCWHNFLTDVFCWIWNFLLSNSFIGSPVSSFILNLGGKGMLGMLEAGGVETELGLEVCNQDRQVSSPSSSSSSSSKEVDKLPAASQFVASCFARSLTPGRLIWGRISFSQSNGVLFALIQGPQPTYSWASKARHLFAPLCLWQLDLGENFDTLMLRNSFW